MGRDDDPGPGFFRCAMCGGTFELGDEDAAQAERAANGLADVECGLVCGDCYRRTPWGRRRQASPTGPDPED